MNARAFSYVPDTKMYNCYCLVQLNSVPAEPNALDGSKDSVY